MDLKEKYRKETGQRTTVEDGWGNTHYLEGYVEWLEEKVAKNLQQPFVSGLLHVPKQIYNFRCSKCWTQYDDAKAGCLKCNCR